MADVEVGTITITQLVDDNGALTNRVTYSDDLPLASALGMLAWGLAFAPSDYEREEDDDA